MESRAGSRGRGRPVGADSRLTRQTILRAARDAISECGYAAATFQQIAQRAGVSRPTLHYYFDTREDVYETLLQDMNAQITSCIAEARQPSGPRARLVAFTEAIERMCSEDPASLRFLVTVQVEQHRGGHRSPTADAMIATIHGFYTSLADAALGGDARAVADMLASVFWGVAFHAGFVAGDEGAAEIVARQLLEAFHDGLLTLHGDAR
ncbi:MAG: TetR/AcrR family transcriptional regulator [Actinomycetota bacterium]